MTKLKRTVYDQEGNEVVDGSPEAVAHYGRALAEAYDVLNEARMLLGLAPDEVDRVWRKRHERIERSLDKHGHAVRMFAEDYAKRSLGSALTAARFREQH